jgi:hypothetical protein
MFMHFVHVDICVTCACAQLAVRGNVVVQTQDNCRHDVGMQHSCEYLEDCLILALIVCVISQHRVERAAFCVDARTPNYVAVVAK